MNKKILMNFLILFLMIVLTGCSQLPNPETKQVCFKGQCVDVEVVWKKEDLQRGLQSRELLEENQGMLFLFDQDQQHRFWMKDTLISLDIIWINKRREVVNMAVYVPPCKEIPCPNYAPNEAARYVLEINAGKSEKMGFKPGDQLWFK